MLLFETPLIMQTQAGEHNHKDFVKSPWRKSNKREPDEFMLKFVQRDTAFRMLGELDKIRAKRTLEESEIIGERTLSQFVLFRVHSKNAPEAWPF
jgi:hypothetical protein